jgi:hypothetical protein
MRGIMIYNGKIKPKKPTLVELIVILLMFVGILISDNRLFFVAAGIWIFESVRKFH